LEVDAFASGLGRDEHLAVLAELTLGVDARVRRVAIADRHAAVDLRHRETPLAELAERAAIASVAREIVQGVLVLGEDEQLHPRVLEDVLLVQDLAELLQLRFDLALLERARLV